MEVGLARRRPLFRGRHRDGADRHRELLCVEASPRSQPVLRRELEIPSARPIRHDTNQRLEVRLGVEVVQHARRDEGEAVGPRLRVDARSAEHPSFAPDSHHAKGIFGKVIVERNPRVSHGTTEVKHVRRRVIRRATNQRFRSLRLSNPARELEKGDEEWSRIRAPKREMVGRTENSSTLGFVLDSIHVCDKLESVVRFGYVTDFEVFPPRMREASTSLAVTLFLQGVITAIIVAKKSACRPAEHVERKVATTRQSKGVAREALTDKGPDKRLRGLRRWLEGGLIRMNKKVLREGGQKRRS